MGLQTKNLEFLKKKLDMDGISDIIDSEVKRQRLHKLEERLSK